MTHNAFIPKQQSAWAQKIRKNRCAFHKKSSLFPSASFSLLQSTFLPQRLFKNYFPSLGKIISSKKMLSKISANNA